MEGTQPLQYIWERTTGNKLLPPLAVLGKFLGLMYLEFLLNFFVLQFCKDASVKIKNLSAAVHRSSRGHHESEERD